MDLDKNFLMENRIMIMRIAMIKYPNGVTNSSLIYGITPILTNKFRKNVPSAFAISSMSCSHVL